MILTDPIVRKICFKQSEALYHDLGSDTHQYGISVLVPEMSFCFLLTNGTCFTCLVEKFASLLTAVNVLSFRQESIIKRECFLDF